MKKMISFALFFFVLLLPAFSSGTQDKSESESQTVKILWMKHWVPGAEKLIQEKAEEWAALNGARIEFDTIAEKDFDFKITSAIENKAGPDLSLFRTSYPILYQDALLDVSDVAEAIVSERGQFFPGCKEETNTGTQWTAVPLYTVVAPWLYRNDIFQDAGVQFPNDYTELVDVAQKVNNPKQGVYGFGTGLSRSRDGILFTQGVLWAFGSKMVSEDGSEVIFDSPETLRGLQYIVDLYARHKVMPPGVAAWDDSSNNKAWLAKQLAMTTNAPSIYYLARTQDPELAKNTRHENWPKGPAGNPVMMDTYSIAIMKYTKQPELVKDLLRYLTSDENYVAFYEAGQGFQAPVHGRYVDHSAFSDPSLKPIMDILPNGHAPGWPAPLTRAAAEVEAQFVLTDMVVRVLVDGLSPNEAVSEAANRISSIYGK